MRVQEVVAKEEFKDHRLEDGGSRSNSIYPCNRRSRNWEVQVEVAGFWRKRLMKSLQVFVPGSAGGSGAPVIICEPCGTQTCPRSASGVWSMQEQYGAAGSWRLASILEISIWHILDSIKRTDRSPTGFTNDTQAQFSSNMAPSPTLL